MTSVVFIVFFVGLFQCSDACNITAQGIKTFGPECQYMCHCVDGAACDVISGACTNGCGPGQYGPGCQFRDLAYKEYTRHNNMTHVQYADRGNDGKTTTCSYTNNASLSRTKPWWRVWLPRNETIRELSILTNDDGKGYFSSFTVTVEYVPSSKNKDNDYTPDNHQICYKTTNRTDDSKTITVLCGQPLNGNQIRIQLNRVNAQLVLCDVRINGGRNFAFGSNAEGSSTNSANKAVDGSLNNSANNVCFTSSLYHNSWIRVDLGREVYVTYVNITKRYDGRLKKYFIQVSNNGTTWSTVYDDAPNSPPTTQVSLSVTTRYLRIKRAPTRIIICELQIFGNCPPNKCGYGCTEECHCKGLETLENRINGQCLTGCEGRWTGINDTCNTECVKNKWGVTCLNECGACKDSTCEVKTGRCPDGCQIGYYKTELCSEACQNQTWGMNCNSTCGYCLNGMCNASNGVCMSGCKSGYKNTTHCIEECKNGTWGHECNTACGSCNEGTCNKTDGECESGCSSGYLETTLCTEECENDTWGHNCSSACGNCLNGTCNKSDGKCEFGCIGGFENTPLCVEECKNGTWGNECNTTCGSCNEGPCNKTDGQCESGCSSGYHDTPLCTEECENDTWGYNCNSTCGYCLNGTCNKSDGKCEFGCSNGFENTPLCDQECQSGVYGRNCEQPCSANCEELVCHHVNGSCTNGCKAGWLGETCKQACSSGTYGVECKNTCSINCQETCNHVDGHCNKCKAGWNGTLCDTECFNGTYGDGCSLVCGKCKNSASCHKVNGSCTVGCATEYEGSLCNIKTEPLVADFPTGAVAGGVSALIVIATVAVGVIFLLRRRHLSLKSRGSTSSLQDIGLNVKGTGEEPDINIKKSDGQNDEYYQFERNVNLETQPRAIDVNELSEFVKTRLTNKELFDKEFQAIPYGLQFPTTEARKVHNAGKNRFKAMYAYDHSRVVLSTLPSNLHSDYINANYIKGYQKERAYIATQGPTEINVADFWRMIWEKDVQLIAMVTNLVENTKQKCIQYWVPVDDSKEYGDFTVYTESEEIFAEFSIRRFKLSKQGEAIQRNIVQYAYTAWPDKDVPSSTCGLLHYWNKVRKYDKNKTHPWLVHCSAGVGRTGTFIALDILYDEAKDAGYVDINMCVRKLREQRVNMVQKEAQYAYLYRIMVEALVLPSTPIALSQFDPWYNEQLGFDSTTGKPKLMLEFEKMVDDIVFVTDTDDKKSEANDCVYANTQIDVNKSKNRYSNILAADEFRPFLSTYVPGTNNYINAVYMPSYNDLHGYLIAQTPLPDTAVDCCRLIIEQEIHVIVTFDDDGDNQVGVYLPSNGSIDIGPFKVTLTSKEEENGYMIQKYCIVYKTKEHTVIQYIYKKWSTYTIVPEEPFHVLQFLHKVDEQDRLFDNKPTLIQCINGAERSGLFVVLMNVIERARMDEEVSIPQVIRYLRTRRQQIVPNYDQYKFCHDVILCYAESNSTYANM